MMNERNEESQLSDRMRSLIEESRSNSEAFSIIGTELIEIKAMLMALIDLQKSSLYATGVSERELESNVQNLIDGYRQRYLSGLEGLVKEAADQQ